MILIDEEIDMPSDGTGFIANTAIKRRVVYSQMSQSTPDIRGFNLKLGFSATPTAQGRRNKDSHAPPFKVKAMRGISERPTDVD